MFRSVERCVCVILAESLIWGSKCGLHLERVALLSTRAGLKRGAAAQPVQLQDSYPFLGLLELCKMERRKWSHLCVKLVQLAAFICGTNGICWWEQTEALPRSESRCFSGRLFLLCLVPLEWSLLELGPGFGWRDLKVGSSQL